MTDLAATPPVGSPDHELLHYLRQVADIGRHKKTWTGADIVRVAASHLAANPMRRELIRERAARAQAESELATMRVRLRNLEGRGWQPPDEDAGVRVVMLTERLSRVLDQIVTGKGNDQAAASLGTTPGTVNNAVSELIREFGAKSRMEVVVAAITGQVVVRVVGRERKAA